MYSNEIKQVEGTFDGENMWGDDNKIYPVPANYASKSKLVEGDRIKLYIRHDGQFIFKQILPQKRKRIMGWIIKSRDKGGFEIIAENKKYKALPASFTYFRAREGDQVVILIPYNNKCMYAAIENIIRKNGDVDEKELELNT